MSALTIDTELPKLSARLRSETANVHDEAETSEFMSGLIGGSLSSTEVVRLSSQQWFIYSALEAAVRRHATDDVLTRFYDPDLERVPALEKDLEHFLGSTWREQIEPLPATQDYVARLNELNTVGDGWAILAHHYVRYLGDISGGQVIRQRMATHYGIADEGLNFYDFAEIGKIPPYRNDYRQRLDELPLETQAHDRMINEARRAFKHNMLVFADLSAQWAERNAQS